MESQKETVLDENKGNEAQYAFICVRLPKKLHEECRDLGINMSRVCAYSLQNAVECLKEVE